MLSLHTHATILIDLHFSLHWGTVLGDKPQDQQGKDHYSTEKQKHQQQQQKQHSQRFPAVAFAADVVVADTPELFLCSLDARCLDRIRAATRHTAFRFDRPVNYEVERWFVWDGLEDSKLAVRGLSAEELASQLRLMGRGRKGCRDVVRVEMAVEIEGGEVQKKRWEGRMVGGGGGREE